VLSQSAPTSTAIAFRKCESLSLVTERDGKTDRSYIVAIQDDGEMVRMPVNDLVRVALKRIFAIASAHSIQLSLTGPLETPVSKNSQ
jgi:hypothetical protein